MRSRPRSTYIIAINLRGFLFGTYVTLNPTVDEALKGAVDVLNDLPLSMIFIPLVNSTRLIEIVSMPTVLSVYEEIVKAIICTALFSLVCLLMNRFKRPLIKRYKLNSILYTVFLTAAKFTVLVIISLFVSIAFDARSYLVSAFGMNLYLLGISIVGIVALAVSFLALKRTIQIKTTFVSVLGYVMVEDILRFMLKVACIVSATVCFIKVPVTSANGQSQIVVYLILIFIFMCLSALVDTICDYLQKVFLRLGYTP